MLLVSVHPVVHLQVAFPAELDVHDFCTPELQQQLKAPRETYRIYQERLAQQKRTAKQLKTDEGPKPGPGAAAAAAAEAEAAGNAADGASSAADVDMKDAEGAAGSSGSVVGAMTGRSPGQVKSCVTGSSGGLCIPPPAEMRSLIVPKTPCMHAVCPL